MKYITELIINEYRLKNIDFMGYVFNKSNASYHHLIIPKRFGGKETLENGVVLNSKTSHPYLHIIESYDKDRFKAITEAMVREKELGRIDIKELERIDDILKGFEKDNKDNTTRKGKILIKEQYINGRYLTRRV